MSWVTPFFEVWIAVFVAMGPLTVLPMFLSMTDGMEVSEMRQLARRAALTAFVVAVTLVLLGQALFRFLSITVDDLRVAGGVILMLISVYDLVFTKERRKRAEVSTDTGVVPLGTPLIVGPGTMTTCVVLADSHGRFLVIGSVLANVIITWLLLHFADQIKRFVPPAVSRAFGKVMSLFLAAIAVAMFRAGIVGFIRGG